MRQWTITMSSLAISQLQIIKDKRVVEHILKRIDKLEHEPDKQGKVLSRELTGYRSVRAIGQRYRILYKVLDEQVVVLVVTVGMRKDGDKKDIYTLATNLARLGLLE